MTSLPIFIKFYQKRKASGRFGFFLFIIIIFLEFQNCFLGLESVSRIFIVLYGALVTRLSSLSTADFKPPSIWKESVLSRKIPFLPKSAATAETPQLPELRLRWHHPWDLGERGRRPWLDLAPTAVLICLGHRPTPSFAIPNSSDVSKEPLPLGVSPPLPAEPHTPEWPQHQPQITAQTSVDYWPAGKGWGGGAEAGWGGGPSSPSCRSKGTKGPEQRCWPPSQLPCPQQLPIQVLQVCRREKHGHKPLITNWFREGKAGDTIYTSPLQLQVEIPTLDRMGPRASTGLEARAQHIHLFAG